MNHIVPVAISYQTMLIENVKGLKEIFSEKEFKEIVGNRLELIKEISLYTSSIKSMVHDMTEARKTANIIEHAKEKALKYSETVVPYSEQIRYHIDKLELIVDNDLWPLPKYRELLFSR